MNFGLAALAGEPPVVGSVENREIAGPESQIPVRIYTPKGKEPFPLLVYFHGGGWVLGSWEVSIPHACTSYLRYDACDI